MNRLVLAVAACCAALTPAFAQTTDRAIVYAARYYTPTGKAESHTHLYRINADGTGKKQITSGMGDEYAPRFLPSGGLFFVRDTGKVGADGAPVSENRVRDLATGAERPATRAEERLTATPEPPPGITVTADKEGVTVTRTDSVAKKSVLRYGAGMTKSRTDDYFSVPLPPQSNLGDPDGYLEPEMLQVFQPLPGNGRLLLRAMAGDSTAGHYYVYLLADEAAGVVRLFSVADEMRFSSSGKQFVATCGRGLLPLGRRDKRTVWVRTLYVGTVKNGAATMRPLVSGRVSIAGYDWRPAIQ